MAVDRVSVASVAGQMGGRIDLFVCCASFEARCLSVAQALAPGSVADAVVAEHVNLRQYVGPNVDTLLGHFGANARGMLLDSGAPIRSLDGMLAALGVEAVGSAQRVLIDITTFTRETLLILLRVLPLLLAPSAQVRLVYTIAEEYAIGSVPGEKWLSKGIDEIRSVLGYPGIMRPGKGVHLILLHGFEVERSKSVITAYEPSVLSIGEPAPQTATSTTHMPDNVRVHQEVVRFGNNAADVDEFVFAPNDPQRSARAILAQATKWPDLNVVVAVMNTKIAVIGGAIAAHENEAIQLCYAQPNMYNYQAYSRPSDACYLFDAPELFQRHEASGNRATLP